MAESLSERVAAVRNSITAAAEKAGRDPRAITLIAVSKTHPADAIREAVGAGLKVFGENKVQEAEAKIGELGRDFAEWHLIGHLQSNKARKAVRLFDAIHSVDSIELAVRLERLCAEEGRQEITVFVQVDLAGESTKEGVSEADLGAVIDFLRGCDRLKLAGLMTLPPYFDDPEAVRPFFRRLRELRDLYIPAGSLSMGMSHDFGVAIEEGATHVRVGTAIFGEREYKR